MAPERMRLTPRSAVVAVALFGLTLALLRLLAASQRVLGWIVAAAAVAALLTPAVDRVARRVPRGLAVAIVVVTTLGIVFGTAYDVVDDVTAQLRVVQDAAPAEAARLERSERFGELASELRLEERVRTFVREVPERLRGGSTADAIRAAATRGVAFLATGVLTIFFLLHGAELAGAAARQIHDARRRERLEAVARRGTARALAYARGTIGLAVLAGLVAYLAARAAEVPGPAPLAVWVALWNVVPVIGTVVGALPIVGLSIVGDLREGLLLAALFLTYQAFEGLVLQRRLERRTVHVGPFLTVVAGFAGLELYGIGGALLSLLAVTLAVAVADEVASSGEADLGYLKGMEESTKHGARLDDALKQRENGDSRVEEFRQTQGPTSDEPLPETGTRPDLDDQVDLSGVEERSEIARFLEQRRFPCGKEELIAGARELFPPDRILSLLRSLPDDRTYHNTQDVWEALGGTTEQRY